MTFDELHAITIGELTPEEREQQLSEALEIPWKDWIRMVKHEREMRIADKLQEMLTPLIKGLQHNLGFSKFPANYRLVSSDALVIRGYTITKISTQWGDIKIKADPTCPPGIIYLMEDKSS